MKIHIIGGPGSGKSYLAEKLSSEYGIPHFDLDDIQWDNSSEYYGTKRETPERTALLRDILSNNSWITEGVYYSWCGECFEKADRIYLLVVPRRVYRRRIINRFIRRKLGMEKGKKETLESVCALLKWADKFERENLVQIREILSEYTNKVIEL